MRKRFKSLVFIIGLAAILFNSCTINLEEEFEDEVLSKETFSSFKYADSVDKLDSAKLFIVDVEFSYHKVPYSSSELRVFIYGLDSYNEDWKNYLHECFLYTYRLKYPYKVSGKDSILLSHTRYGKTTHYKFYK